MLNFRTSIFLDLLFLKGCDAFSKFSKRQQKSSEPPLSSPRKLGSSEPPRSSPRKVGNLLLMVPNSDSRKGDDDDSSKGAGASDDDGGGAAAADRAFVAVGVSAQPPAVIAFPGSIGIQKTHPRAGQRFREMHHWLFLSTPNPLLFCSSTRRISWSDFP